MGPVNEKSLFKPRGRPPDLHTDAARRSKTLSKVGPKYVFVRSPELLLPASARMVLNQADTPINIQAIHS